MIRSYSRRATSQPHAHDSHPLHRSFTKSSGARSSRSGSRGSVCRWRPTGSRTRGWTFRRVTLSSFAVWGSGDPVKPRAAFGGWLRSSQSRRLSVRRSGLGSSPRHRFRASCRPSRFLRPSRRSRRPLVVIERAGRTRRAPVRRPRPRVQTKGPFRGAHRLPFGFRATLS